MAIVPNFNGTTNWTGGGYDPNAAPAGGYDPLAAQNTAKGGYDPNAQNAYITSYNSIGGAAAQSQNYNIGATYDNRGGYVPGQVESTGGGYDPNAQNNYITSYNSIGGAAAISENYSGGPDMGYNALTGNKVPGDAAISENYMGAPNFSVQDMASPDKLRLQGFSAGGTNGKSATSVQVIDQDGPGGQEDKDWRVRVSLAPKSKIFYKDESNLLLAPLKATSGVVWPYVPQITITHNANYGSSSLTHSIYPQNYYNYSDVSDISISGEFTVQDVFEGQYLMAVIYFLRAATKMFFGNEQSPKIPTGNPPPLVFLNGYGKHYFPHIPCVITSFTHTMGSDVDYVPIPVPVANSDTKVAAQNIQPPPMPKSNSGSTAGVNFLENNGIENTPSLLRSPPPKVAQTTVRETPPSQQHEYTRLPTVSTIQVSLKPMYSRLNLFNNFNLEDFAKGALIRDPASGRGGFI